MEKLVITGQKPLMGEVYISGAKNAAVAVLPAAILSDDICIIENLPDIEDVRQLIDILKKMGCKCEYLSKNTVKIDPRNIKNFSADYDAVKKLRASYYLMGALLGKFSKAEVSLPGGCDFGTRPIDLHIKGFESLGAEVKMEHGMVKMNAKKLRGTNIYLDRVSVGSTINIMLAACKSEGLTTIENAAKEPHVVDTANFLNIMGANIKGAGTDLIRITGVSKLKGGQYMIIPDQIEAGTYMIAAAITNGNVKVRNVIPKHMDSLSSKLIETGVKLIEGDDYIEVVSSGKLKATNIQTMPYPGFPTDLQPQMVSLLCTCSGTSIVTENIWENRYQYINELKRLGCEISMEGRTSIIIGPSDLSGTELKASDLRAGAAFIIAALAAKGESVITNIKYVDRGYEDIELKLKNLGADIRRIEA